MGPYARSEVALPLQIASDTLAGMHTRARWLEIVQGGVVLCPLSVTCE